MSKLRGLRRDERASIMPLFLFLLIMFAVALVYLIDSGLAIRRKINLQQAADSAAVSQAQWTARSLNILSMNNVAQSQLYTTWSIAFSMDTYIRFTELKVDALIILEIAHAADIATSCAKLKFPPAIAACLAVFGGDLARFEADRRRKWRAVENVERRYRFHRGANYSAAAIKALRESNDYLVDQSKHQKRLGYIARNTIFSHSFGDNVYSFGGKACTDGKTCSSSQDPEGPEIPVMRARFEGSNSGRGGLAMVQFCNAMDTGSSANQVRRGYSGSYSKSAASKGRGWETGRGPWHLKNKRKEYYKHVNELTDIGGKVGNLDTFFRTRGVPGIKIKTAYKTPNKAIPGFPVWPNGTKRQSKNDNAYLFLVELIDNIYCQPTNTGLGATLINSSGLSGSGLANFSSSIMKFLDFPDFAVPEPVALSGGEDFLNSILGQGNLGLGALYASQDMNVLTVVRAEGGGKNVLGGNGGAIPSYAYAQAQIYNPTAPDLYTQDWNARLVHASILSGRVDSALGGIGPISSILSGDKRANVRDVLNEMRTQAGPGFTPFIEAYEDISSAYSDQGNASASWGDTFVN